MGNKFSEFLNTDINYDNKNDINDNINYKETNNNLDTKTAEELINKYSTYSKEELMQELKKITDEKKKNGTLNDDLNRFSSVLTPYLNEEQKSRMNDLFNKIK